MTPEQQLNQLTSLNLKRVIGVYGWIHRASGMCYVVSSANIGRRIKRHLLDTKNGSDTAHHRAIREFGWESFDVELLEECDIGQLLQREEFYISLLGAASTRGFNTRSKPTKDGRGSRVSEATKERMSASHIGFRHSADTRAGMSAYWTGKTPSAETRKKLSAINKGKKPSPEALAKRSKTMKALYASNPWPPPNAEQRARISATLTGRKLPPEHRAKVSAALTGKKRSPESAAKTAAGNRGQKRTQESRDKMRASALAYQARKREGIDMPK